MSIDHQEREVEFIQKLLGLVPGADGERERKGDRGALAVLRRGLRKGAAGDLRAYHVVGPFLTEDPEENDRRFVVAALFALHPKHHWEGASLGAVCRQLGEHDSARQRFVALLNSHREELPDRLRQIISLARSRSEGAVAINYLKLLRDLRHWDASERWVQERWAREYWRPAPVEVVEHAAPAGDE